MALASAYGLNYELPQQGATQPQGRTQTQGNPLQGPDFGEGNLLEQELYVKEGMTDEYYKKVAALKSFANEVSSRYGFDVTRPDYRNPDSIRFHRSYLEALADLQATQNNLRRLASQENIAIQNPNVRQRTDAQGQDYFANIGENSVVAAMRAAASQVKSREGLQGFEVARQDLIDQLSEELSTAQTPRERDQITASIRQLEAIRPDVGISDAQQAQLDLSREQLDQTKRYQDASLNLRAREVGIAESKAAQASQPFSGMTKTQTVSLLGRLETIEQITNPESLKSLGFDRVDRASGTYLERTVDGKRESVKIDPKDPSGTLFNINELINKSGKGAKVTYDLLAGSGLDLDQVAQGVISALNPSEDKFSGFIQSFPEIAKKASGEPITRDALATSLNSKGVKIPASVSSKFTNAIAEDMDVQKVEPVSGWFSDSGIKITLQKKNQKDKTSTKTLYFNSEEDVRLMREIFEYNSRTIDLPPSLGGQGTVVAPTSTGGPIEIDLDQM